MKPSPVGSETQNPNDPGIPSLTHAGGAGLAIVLDKGMEEWLSVVVTDELKGLVLAKVSGDQMVVFVEENV